MEKIAVQVEVAKESYELGLALALIVKAVRAALIDGLGADDIPALLASLMTKEFIAGIQGIEALGHEWAEDKEAMVAAFVIAASKISSDLKV